MQMQPKMDFNQHIPKILQAKKIEPVSESTASAAAEDAPTKARPSTGALKFLNESLEYTGERLQQLLTENSDFMVIGVIGPLGSGKSSLLNAIGGLTEVSGSTPFLLQSEQAKASGKQSTVGIDARVSAERIILLDTQAVLCGSNPSFDPIRTNGIAPTSLSKVTTVPYEIGLRFKDIQLALFVCSVCHLVFLISDSLNDISVWTFMKTVEMLKHGIVDPFTQPTAEKKADVRQEEYFPQVIFVQQELESERVSVSSLNSMYSALSAMFLNSSFQTPNPIVTSFCNANKPGSSGIGFWNLPYDSRESEEKGMESYKSSVQLLRNKVLAMSRNLSPRIVSEKEWLKSSSKVWDSIKKSPVLNDYCQFLKTAAGPRVPS